MCKGFLSTQFPSKLSKKKKRERRDYSLRNSMTLLGSCLAVQMLPSATSLSAVLSPVPKTSRGGESQSFPRTWTQQCIWISVSWSLSPSSLSMAFLSFDGLWSPVQPSFCWLGAAFLPRGLTWQMTLRSPCLLMMASKLLPAQAWTCGRWAVAQNAVSVKSFPVPGTQWFPSSWL